MMMHGLAKFKFSKWCFLYRLHYRNNTSLLNSYGMPISVAMRSKAWDCGCSLAGIAGSNLNWHGCLHVVSFLCCQIEVTASG